MATRTRMTIDEFLELPETKPYAELVAGEVRPKMSPSGEHQDIEVNLLEIFLHHPSTQEGKARPELRLRFDDPFDPRSLVPDFAYYRDRRDYSTGTQNIPPNLAVEVRSHGQPVDELREKCRYNLDHGVEAAWIVDPYADTVEVWDDEHDGIVFGRSGTVRFDALAVLVEDILTTD